MGLGRINGSAGSGQSPAVFQESDHKGLLSSLTSLSSLWESAKKTDSFFDTFKLCLLGVGICAGLGALIGSVGGPAGAGLGAIIGTVVGVVALVFTCSMVAYNPNTVRSFE